MSEIKGQLLGIILVVTIFGIVGGALAAIFSTLTNTVEDKVSEEIATFDSLGSSAAYDGHYLQYSEK